MPKFNYKKARFELGMTPEEIVQFLDSEAAEGRTYSIDPAAYPALRIARQLAATSNPQAEAEAPPFYLDPTEAAATLAGGGKGAFQAGMGTAEAVANRVAPGMLRKAGGKLLEAGMDTATHGKTAVARQLMNLFRRGPDAPVNVPMPPGATAVPAPAASALPGGFSQTTSTASQVVPEAVTARIAAAAESGAAKAGNEVSEAGRALAAKRWAGRSKPKLEVVEGKSAGAQRIAKTKENPAEAFKPKHDVQYYSESKGQHINIEDMNQKHLEQAYRKLALKNPKPNSVAAKVMKAMLDEAKYRLLKTGIHIGQ